MSEPLDQTVVQQNGSCELRHGESQIGRHVQSFTSEFLQRVQVGHAIDAQR